MTAAVLLVVPRLLIGQSSNSLFVAVVRSDGSMVPIAHFDGREWSNPWPASRGNLDEQLPTPRSVAEIPADWLPAGTPFPSQWLMHSEERRATPISVVHPVSAEMLEENVPGVQIEPRPKERDGIADAVAVSGSAVVRPFVTASRRETQSIQKQMAGRLSALERFEIDKWLQRDGLPAETAAKLTPALGRPGESPSFLLKRVDTAVNGLTYFHLSGQKLYALGDPADCEMIWYFDGIVTADSRGRVTNENLTAYAWGEHCDRPHWNEPVASIQVSGQHVWVVVSFLEDGFDYDLLDPRTNEPVRFRQ